MKIWSDTIEVFLLESIFLAAVPDVFYMVFRTVEHLLVSELGNLQVSRFRVKRPDVRMVAHRPHKWLIIPLLRNILDWLLHGLSYGDSLPDMILVLDPGQTLILAHCLVPCHALLYYTCRRLHRNYMRLRCFKY